MFWGGIETSLLGLSERSQLWDQLREIRLAGGGTLRGRGKGEQGRVVASWVPDVSSLHTRDGKVVSDHGHNSDLWLAVTMPTVTRIEARVCSDARNYPQKISAQMSVSPPYLMLAYISRFAIRSRFVRLSFAICSRFFRIRWQYPPPARPLFLFVSFCVPFPPSFPSLHWNAFHNTYTLAGVVLADEVQFGRATSWW